MHTGASGNRDSGSSPYHLLLLMAAPRSPPMLHIAPERWTSCIKPPSSCSHHLLAHLRNAQIIRCGEHVKVSRGLRAGSSLQRCLPEVNPRCLAAGRRSPPDIASTLSVRRADLRRFTRRSRRRYHSRSSALRDLDRTWTGTWRRSATVYPSRRRWHIPCRAERQTVPPSRPSGGMSRAGNEFLLHPLI